MSTLRTRAGLLVGIPCLVLLLLLLLFPVVPAPVNAAGESRPPRGAPRDPGSPFEEPEYKDPDAPEECQPIRPVDKSWQQPSPSPSPAGGDETVTRILRRIVLRRMVLVLWRQQ